jgi:hypothetical protein
MGKEGQPVEAAEVQAAAGIPVNGLLIDLEERSLTMLAKTEVLAKVTLSPSGIIFESGATPPGESVAVPESTPPPVAPSATPASVETSAEKARTVTLNGRLKSKPREGRPDAQGKPTAWARFAAHEEDRDTAHIYSTTFHKHTAPIALGLDTDAPLTIQGYPHLHQQDDPGSKRMDTLSVINLVDYPGKGKTKPEPEQEVSEAQES